MNDSKYLEKVAGLNELIEATNQVECEWDEEEEEM